MPRRPQLARLTNFDFYAPSPANTPAVRAALGRDITGLLRSMEPGEAEWPADKQPFAPRIGLAYQLDRKTVVRAGYALFYLPLSVENLGSVGFNYTINGPQPNPRVPENHRRRRRHHGYRSERTDTLRSRLVWTPIP